MDSLTETVYRAVIGYARKGLLKFRPGQRSALRVLSIVALTLALSGAALPHVQAQGWIPGGAVYVRFGGDTPLTNGVACKGQTYKILMQPVVVVGKVRKQVSAHITVDAGLNPPVTPSPLDLGEDGGAGIFYYDAAKTGTETITYRAFFNPTIAGSPATGPGFSHPEIAEGTLSFDVKECQYKVILVYSLSVSIASVIAYMDETELTSKSGGPLEGDGSFDFQQTLYGTPCGTKFTAVSFPTHITATVTPVKSLADPKAGVTLQFTYGEADTTLSAVCPIAGATSASHDVSPASLGVSSVHLPIDGGVRLFNPSLGGRFVVIVTQDVK